MAPLTIAVTGETVLNRRVSVATEQRFLSVVGILRDADIAYTHLETLIHDYDGPEVYPAAEAGWTWMRSPAYVAEELRWMGFDMVSLASNHCLDYSYGGLFHTWDALNRVGILHAGTGRNLGEAREPAYLDTSKGRVALISMCSTFNGWARAGEARRDLKGRPGLNPLRFYYVVDPKTMETIKELAVQFGWWVTHIKGTWLLNPPGLHMTVHKFVEGDRPGIHPVVDEDDAEDNLRYIRNATGQADYVLVHLHFHEWDAGRGLSVPAPFVPPFARACIDAGADLFIGQGSHSPMRGMEIYKGKPIFYDPGDFIAMPETVTRLPADFYWRAGYDSSLRDWQALNTAAFDARAALPKPLSPPGGYNSAPVQGAVIALCSFEEDGKLTELKLRPTTQIHAPRSKKGLPLSPDVETGRKIIEHLAELSAPFGTQIDFRDEGGLVRI